MYTPPRDESVEDTIVQIQMAPGYGSEALPVGEWRDFGRGTYNEALKAAGRIHKSPRYAGVRLVDWITREEV